MSLCISVQLRWAACATPFAPRRAAGVQARISVSPAKSTAEEELVCQSACLWQGQFSSIHSSGPADPTLLIFSSVVCGNILRDSFYVNVGRHASLQMHQENVCPATLSVKSRRERRPAQARYKYSKKCSTVVPRLPLVVQEELLNTFIKNYLNFFFSQSNILHLLITVLLYLTFKYGAINFHLLFWNCSF